MNVYSFSYKHGKSPVDPLNTVDVRMLANPHSVPGLRHLDGRHEDVQAYVRNDPAFLKIITATFWAHLDEGDVAFGCYGGRHRSVACAEAFAEKWREQGREVKVIHTALES